MPKKSSLVICKNEQCLACFNKVADRMVDDELEIVCQLQLDGAVEVDDEDCETCGAFSQMGARDEEHQSKADEGDNSVTRRTWSATEDDDDEGKSEGEEVETEHAQFIFVGNSLARVDDGRQSAMDLPINFAESWNLQVQQFSGELEQYIAQMQAALTSKIESAKDILRSGNYDHEHPEQIFMSDEEKAEDIYVLDDGEEIDDEEGDTELELEKGLLDDDPDEFEDDEEDEEFEEDEDEE